VGLRRGVGAARGRDLRSGRNRPGGTMDGGFGGWGLGIEEHGIEAAASGVAGRVGSLAARIVREARVPCQPVGDSRDASRAGMLMVVSIPICILISYNFTILPQ
jgi:hypothetical protein